MIEMEEKPLVHLIKLAVDEMTTEKIEAVEIEMTEEAEIETIEQREIEMKEERGIEKSEAVEGRKEGGNETGKTEGREMKEGHLKTRMINPLRIEVENGTLIRMRHVIRPSEIKTTLHMMEVTPRTVWTRVRKMPGGRVDKMQTRRQERGSIRGERKRRLVGVRRERRRKDQRHR